MGKKLPLCKVFCMVSKLINLRGKNQFDLNLSEIKLETKIWYFYGTEAAET